MGQFANTLFSVLLGWLQTAAAGLWALITNADTSVWLRWVLDNWLVLTLILCGAGLVLDFLVYLFRWQPYRVWRSFLRRVKARASGSAEEEQQLLYQRKWVYADGSTSVEDVRHPRQPDVLPDGTERLELPIRPVRRVARHAPDEQAYYQPVYPPQWQQKEEENQGGTP